MISMFRKPIVLAAFAAMGLFGTSARADLIVSIQEDAGPTQVFITLGSPTTPGGVTAGTFSTSTADYAITVLTGTEEQAPPNPLSEVLSSNTLITYTGAADAGHVLHVTITGTGFTNPVTPPNVLGQSHIGGTVPTLSPNTNDALSFQSIVGGTAFPVQTPAVNVNGSYSNDTSKVITSLTAPYSIQEVLNITLNGTGDQINYSSSTTLTSAVPEPSSVAFAGLGALCGIIYSVRRRKRQDV